MNGLRTLSRFVLVFSAIAMMMSAKTYPQQPPADASKQAGAASQVHRIVLPQYPPEITAGSNVETYRTNCLMCHTARYVSMQPRFSKTVWQNEVKKMVDVYGAAISEADQALIVEYLVAVKGIETPVATPTTPK